MGKAEKWWGKAYSAMALDGGWEDTVAINKEKGFYNHSSNAITKTGPLDCFWELKEGISAEEFKRVYRWPFWSRIWLRCTHEYLQTN